MIQDHTQYLLNKEDQHLKWQPRKSWTSYPDYHADDKQQMQYPLIPWSQWMMHHLNWRSQSQNVQIFGCVNRNTNGPNHGPVWKTQLFLLSGICTVILWQDSYGNGDSRKFSWNTDGEAVPNWEFLFVNREKGLFLSVYVDDVKLAGKKQNVNPMWEQYSTKKSDLGEPTSFLGQVFFGCTQRECQIGKEIVDNYRSMFESRISPEAMDKLPETKATGETWCRNDIFMVPWHGRSCKEMRGKILRTCEKTTEQLYKVATPCMDHHHF